MPKSRLSARRYEQVTTQWSTLTRSVIIGVGLVLLGWLLYSARQLLAPLIVAILLAYTLNPLVKLVQIRLQFSRTWAVSLVYFLTLAIVVTIPGAIVLGILTGLLTVIPDIGPAIAALLAVLIAYFQGSNVLPMSSGWFAVLVFAIYFILIQIKSIWLRPRVMKHFLHMNEGLIFVAIIGATVVWGILGALIIVPLIATAGVVGRYMRCRLLHLEPWPTETDNSTVTGAKIPESEGVSSPDGERSPAGKHQLNNRLLSAPVESALVWSRREPL
jgi:predicted PurR-regulated permease PerM